MRSLLRFDSVDACYDRAHILHGVSFNVPPGASVAILGRNGVGKTTVVNTLLGIARLTGGRIDVFDRPFRQIRHYTAARSGIAVVVQGRGIFPNLTVRENLLLSSVTGRTGVWTMERVFELFPVLRERVDTSGTALSGGQQQMLALGRALMSNPRLLVLDEPSEGLAPIIVDEVAEILCRLRGEGTAILLIEQNLSLVRRVAHEFYVLSKGSIVEHGQISGASLADLHKHVAI